MVNPTGTPEASRLSVSGGQSVVIELQAALEAVKDAEPRVVHDHGSEFVNSDVAAVIKTHNLIDIKTRPRHPESNGIVERFNGTVRDESDNDYGNNYPQAEASELPFLATSGTWALLPTHLLEVGVGETLGSVKPSDLRRSDAPAAADPRRLAATLGITPAVAAPTRLSDIEVLARNCRNVAKWSGGRPPNGSIRRHHEGAGS